MTYQVSNAPILDPKNEGARLLRLGWKCRWEGLVSQDEGHPLSLAHGVLQRAADARHAPDVKAHAGVDFGAKVGMHDSLAQPAVPPRDEIPHRVVLIFIPPIRFGTTMDPRLWFLTAS